MTTRVAFWDSSALVPLCVKELNSTQAGVSLRSYTQVVWWASEVEVFGAIARLFRSGMVNEVGRDEALQALQSLAEQWSEVSPTSELRKLAKHLLDAYPLRAADSLQLAAALTWCREHPAGRTFICGDKRLGEAAKAAGFTVVELGAGKT